MSFWTCSAAGQQAERDEEATQERLDAYLKTGDMTDRGITVPTDDILADAQKLGKVYDDATGTFVDYPSGATVLRAWTDGNTHLAPVPEPENEEEANG